MQQIIQLPWLHLFADIQTPVLQAQKLLPYLPSGWIVSLHKKLFTENIIQVEVSNLWVAKPRQGNDQHVRTYVVRYVPYVRKSKSSDVPMHVMYRTYVRIEKTELHQLYVRTF